MFFVIVSFLMTFLVPVAFVAGVFVGWTPAKSESRSASIDLTDPRLRPFLHPMILRDIRAVEAVHETVEKILDAAEKKGLL